MIIFMISNFVIIFSVVIIFNINSWVNNIYECKNYAFFLFNSWLNFLCSMIVLTFNWRKISHIFHQLNLQYLKIINILKLFIVLEDCDEFLTKRSTKRGNYYNIYLHKNLKNLKKKKSHHSILDFS